MPRPAPIIIPGQFGMGGSMQSSESETDILGSLLKLGQLYKVYQDTIGAQKARSESAPALAQFLGLDKSTPDQPGAVTDSAEEGGFVNAQTAQPGRPGMSPEQIQNLSKSGILPEMVLQQVKNQGQMTSDKAIAQMFRMGNISGAQQLGSITKPASAANKQYTQTKNMKDLTGNTDTMHVYKYNPKTQAYDIDQGLGPDSYANVAGNTRGMSVVDPNNPGKAIAMSWNEIQALHKKGVYPEVASYAPQIKQKMAEAGQRGGANTANINDAYQTYKSLAPQMKALRQKVADNNLLPSGGFKKIEQLDQWVQDNSSNPEMADMATSIGMMSESLSRALGSTQGGEFMLKYANTLLDKNFAPEAFNRVVDRHLETLYTKLKTRRTFGNEKVPENPLDKENTNTIQGAHGEY